MIVPALGFLARNWKLAAAAGSAAWMYKDKLAEGFNFARQHPTEAFNNTKAAVTGAAQTVDGALMTARGTIDSVTGGLTPAPAAGGAATESPSLLDRALGAVGLGGKGENDNDGESGLPWWAKMLGIGGAAWGGMKLFKKLFGSDSKENENSSGIGSSLVMIAAVIGAAVLAFKNWDGLKSGFHKVTGNIFNADTPSVAQRVTGDLTGRSATLVPTPAPLPTSDTALGRTFVAARDPEGEARAVINRAAGRPVRATVEGSTTDLPTRDVPELETLER